MVQVWDAASGKPVGEPMRHESEVVAASFSPDGRRIVTSYDETARVWDAESGKPVGEPMRHEDRVNWQVSARTGGGSSLYLTTIPRGCGTRRAASRWASQCAMRIGWLRQVLARTGGGLSPRLATIPRECGTRRAASRGRANVP